MSAPPPRRIGLLGALCAGALAALVPTVALAAPAATVSAGPPDHAALAAVDPQADANAFFPRAVTIRAGESVQWVLNGFHTVSFFGPNGPVPLATPTAASEPAAADAAGTPFWWAGVAPVVTLNPLLVAPQGGSSFDPGTLDSSGLLRILAATTGPPEPYTLTFPSPGLYRYFCAVHPNMSGLVRVLPAAAPAPSAQATARRLQNQTAATLRSLRHFAAHRAPGRRVLVGQGNLSGPSLLSMAPRTLTVKVGQTVTFQNASPTEIHTVTFGPDALRAGIEQTFISLQGTPPTPTFNPLAAYPSEPPGSPSPVRYDGTNHGNGYLNSGILAPRGAPAAAGPQSFRVTFTRAGTFNYECVIHANMDGTIVVTPR